ncbi:MAG TPA: glycosyltransferase [bacterium]|nr:glycosyltransferase [bacterium]
MPRNILHTPGVTGLMWVGPAFEASGYGAVSRAFVFGLTDAGLPVQLRIVGADDRKLLEPGVGTRLVRLRGTDVGPYPAGLVHYTPDFYPRVRFKNVVRRIGYTIFETDRIPENWAVGSQSIEELWVPSRFNYETFSASGIDAAKLRVFPYGVDTEFFKPVTDRLEIGARRGFCFLYVFPFDWRKGFDLLLEAYCAEFHARDDVTLVLKTQSDRHAGAELERLVRGCLPASLARRTDLPHVAVIAQRMDAVQLRALYNTCDLYISTERASGWGMPCMEAMAMGKPVAAIGWGGSTEFMNEQNSLLIRPTGRLVPVDERLAELRRMYHGHRWAEVKVDEVRRVLRLAYDHRRMLPGLARRGMRDVRDAFSQARAAGRIHEYLRSLPVRTAGRPSVEVRRSIGARRVAQTALVRLKTTMLNRFAQR